MTACAWCPKDAQVFGTMPACDGHEWMLDVIMDDLYRLRKRRVPREVWSKLIETLTEAVRVRDLNEMRREPLPPRRWRFTGEWAP